MFALFALATLACGLAPGYAALMLARCAAGAFGGVLGSMVQTMVGDLIPFERRGRASGTIMSAFALSTVAGVPLSLLLANHFGWRFALLLHRRAGRRLLAAGLAHAADAARPPRRRRQARANARTRWPPWAAVLRDANHLRALAFIALIMLSGFMVIPYITLYSVANVGIRQEDIPLIYLAGGCATFFTSRLIGRLADRHGKVRTYRLIALSRCCRCCCRPTCRRCRSG
jgi:predicted MFS family arabinose efflux permease